MGKIEMMLVSTFDALKEAGVFADVEVPVYVSNNLAVPLRPYQEEAYLRFAYYMDLFPAGKTKQNKHLLFHMATGSGKTLLMAELILDLYVRGYRNFLFFVNSTNIIEKTRDNFVNSLSSKYLFAETIKIDGKTVHIRSIDNFDDANLDDINICFTTVQGLHTRLNTPKENALTEEDFESKQIVLIADEAHHMSAWTKSGGADRDENSRSWEETVTNKVFLKNPNNILLEFTATVDLTNQDIARKYEDKIIFDYSLKQFRKDGYSKEIMVLQSNLSDMDRLLQAVILSQYRLKLSDTKHLFIKPVVLVKSKTIKESQANYDNFYNYLNSLTAESLFKLKEASVGTALEIAFKFFEDNNITAENLILELQEDFSEDKSILFDSNSISPDLQIKANTLEAESNPVRIIFAVDMLDEGWDVLNLFDIVRLYDTRDSKNNKIGKTTMREAQLIGRGARYCPFEISEKEGFDKYKRKYDIDAGNPMSALETLYYHSKHNPKYITEIKQALRETGIMAEAEPVEIHLKESFKNTDFYNNGLVYTNARVKNMREEKQKLSDYCDNKIFHYPVHLFAASNHQDAVMQDNINFVAAQKSSEKIYPLNYFGEAALRFALDNNSFFTFNNLSYYIYKLPSLKLFIDRDLSDVQVGVTGTESRLKSMTMKEKRDIVSFVLSEIEKIITSNDTEFKGTKLFVPKAIKDVFKNKRFIPQDTSITSLKQLAIAGLQNINLFEAEWFVYDDNYGTSEEQELVAYFANKADEIKKIYSEFYLIRNEKQLKIYDFDNGAATEPDFLLFALKQGEKQNQVFQIFVEPKGEHLLEKDKWKEDLLLSISNNAELAFCGLNNYQYKLFGTPFFNKNLKERQYNDAVNDILNLE